VTTPAPQSAESARQGNAARHARLLSTPLRIAAAVGGLVALGLTWLFGVGAALGADSRDSDEAWYIIASLALLALVFGALGLQLLYLGATGRRRGPVHRWLSAFVDGWARHG
jgi:hypothetical protein